MFLGYGVGSVFFLELCGCVNLVEIKFEVCVDGLMFRLNFVRVGIFVVEIELWCLMLFGSVYLLGCWGVCFFWLEFRCLYVFVFVVFVLYLRLIRLFSVGLLESGKIDFCKYV